MQQVKPQAIQITCDKSNLKPFESHATSQTSSHSNHMRQVKPQAIRITCDKSNLKPFESHTTSQTSSHSNHMRQVKPQAIRITCDKSNLKPFESHATSQTSSHFVPQTIDLPCFPFRAAVFICLKLLFAACFKLGVN